MPHPFWPDQLKIASAGPDPLFHCLWKCVHSTVIPFIPLCMQKEKEMADLKEKLDRTEAQKEKDLRVQ